MAFTNAEKREVIELDLRVLHRDYRKFHRAGMVIRLAKIERKIAILTAVANDYRDKEKQGPLFEQVT